MLATKNNIGYELYIIQNYVNNSFYYILHSSMCTQLLIKCTCVEKTKLFGVATEMKTKIKIGANVDSL